MCVTLLLLLEPIRIVHVNVLRASHNTEIKTCFCCIMSHVDVLHELYLIRLPGSNVKETWVQNFDTVTEAIRNWS